MVDPAFAVDDQEKVEIVRVFAEAAQVVVVALAFVVAVRVFEADDWAFVVVDQVVVDVVVDQVVVDVVVDQALAVAVQASASDDQSVVFVGDQAWAFARVDYVA